MRAAAIAPACAAFVCAAHVAVAQDLPRLHITALGMQADRASVATGETYHVTIHVHITERRDRLDELQLPTLTNAVDLGDERRRVASSDGGTDFYEIMTVASPDAGSASFSSAYIDAIDPRGTRGLRYSSNPVTVRVDGASSSESNAFDGVTRRLMRVARDLAVGGVAIVIAALGAVAILRRRRRAAATATPFVQQQTRSLGVVDPVAAAITSYRARRDDAALDALRSALFTRAGAQPGATLTDALRALGLAHPALGRAMSLAERVRFGPERERDSATRDLDAALDALQRHPVGV